MTARKTLLMLYVLMFGLGIAHTGFALESNLSTQTITSTSNQQQSLADGLMITIALDQLAATRHVVKWVKLIFWSITTCGILGIFLLGYHEYITMIRK